MGPATSFPRMMAVGGFFSIFEPIPGSSEIPTGSMWVRDERRSRRGRKRLWECLGRRRRDAMVSDALEVFMGARGLSAAPTRPRGPFGRSTVENGAGTGTAVCVPRPGTPVAAAVDLDVVWSSGVPPAGS